MSDKYDLDEVYLGTKWKKRRNDEDFWQVVGTVLLILFIIGLLGSCQKTGGAECGGSTFPRRACIEQRVQTGTSSGVASSSSSSPLVR